MADRRAADDPFIMDLFNNVTSAGELREHLADADAEGCEGAAKESYGVSDPEVRGLSGRIRTETG